MNQLATSAEHLRSVEIDLDTISYLDCDRPSVETVVSYFDHFGVVLKHLTQASTIISVAVWWEYINEAGLIPNDSSPIWLTVHPCDSGRTRRVLGPLLQQVQAVLKDPPLVTDWWLEDHEGYLAWVEELLQSLLSRCR